VRLRMLTERLRAWQIAQPLYGAGPVVAAVGVGFLAAASAGGSRAVLAAACAALAIGALAWGWSLYLRGTHVSEFAFGTLPGWPFATYVLLTIGGIATGSRPADRRFSELAGMDDARRRRRLSGRLSALQGHPAVRLLPTARVGRAGCALTSVSGRVGLRGGRGVLLERVQVSALVLVVGKIETVTRSQLELQLGLQHAFKMQVQLGLPSAVPR
jgi:hypothetical protein